VVGLGIDKIYRNVRAQSSENVSSLFEYQWPFVRKLAHNAGRRGGLHQLKLGVRHNQLPEWGRDGLNTDT